MITISHIKPNKGPTGGGTLVEIGGTGFSDDVEVRFGGKPGHLIGVQRRADGTCSAFVKTPRHQVGVVSVSVRNPHNPKESITLPGAFVFHRPKLVVESNLQRLVRKVLQLLKAQLLENSVVNVSVDYSDASIDGVDVIAMAELPALALSGPRLSQNRTYESRVIRTETTEEGARVIRYVPAFVVDAELTLTGASEHTAELLSLIEATAAFLHRNRWLELEDAKFEMAPAGDWQISQHSGRGGAFAVSFVVRGFPLDQFEPLDVVATVDEVDVLTSTL